MLAIEMAQERSTRLIHWVIIAALATTQTFVAIITHDLAEEAFLRVKPEKEMWVKVVFTAKMKLDRDKLLLKAT